MIAKDSKNPVIYLTEQLADKLTCVFHHLVVVRLSDVILAESHEHCVNQLALDSYIDNKPTAYRRARKKEVEEW